VGEQGIPRNEGEGEDLSWWEVIFPAGTLSRVLQCYSYPQSTTIGRIGISLADPIGFAYELP